MAIPEFGTRVPGQIYRPRPGAYGVVRDAAGRVAVVHAPNGCFLPGGGIDGSENPIDALSREIREECGFQAGIGSLIGQANEFVSDWEKQCAFYHARFGEPLSSGPVETVHRL